MENTPVKSKAFIITFIVVLILLIAGYFIFKNKDTLFSTNSIAGKIFNSGSNGTQGNNTGNTNNNITPIDINQNNNGSDNTGNTNNGTNGSNDNNNNDNWGGKYKMSDWSGDFSDMWGDIPTLDYDGNTNMCEDVNGDNYPCDILCENVAGDLVLCDQIDNNNPQCSDGKDNDGDNLVDKNDPGCHSDYNATNGVDVSFSQTKYELTGDAITGVSSYLPNRDDESWENNSDGDNDDDDDNDQNGDTCPSYPLTFTAEEQEKLDKLVRKFYLMAGTLKTEEDVLAMKEEHQEQKTLKDQVEELTQQCVDQKFNTTYTGPKTVKSNPFFEGEEYTYHGQATNWYDASKKEWVDTAWYAENYQCWRWNDSCTTAPAMYYYSNPNDTQVGPGAIESKMIHNMEFLLNIW